MFDVSWTDPSRQKVGERKNRKQSSERSSSVPRNDCGPAPRIPLPLPLTTRASSIRSSGSRESDTSHAFPSTTVSSSRPSFLNIFGSSSNAKAKNIKPKLSSGLGSDLSREKEQRSSSILQTESANAHSQATRERRLSTYTSTSDDASVPRVFTPTTRMRILESEREFFVNEEYHSDMEQDSPSDISESIFSERTGRSTKTNSTWSSALESTSSSRKTLQSPKSFLVQRTEATASPREGKRHTELDKAATMHVSAAVTIPILVHDSPSRRSTLSTTYDFPIPRFGETEGRSVPRLEISEEPELWLENSRAKKLDGWIPYQKLEHPLEENEVLSAPINFKPRILDLPSRPARPQRTDSRQRANKTPSVEMMQLQKTIRRMEAASDRIVLERLKEEWVEVADASVYRELELEKQLWMLTALRRKAGKTNNQVEEISQYRSSKILSLYENHASCSSLSVLKSSSEVHHLSASPLSRKLYTNIHPLPVPGPTAELPYASNTFDLINAFSLPALLPASSIPTILKECHRTLVSTPTPPSPTLPVCFSSAADFTQTIPLGKGGVLHLTILDPAPLPSTLGPRLRFWLDNNLILNLEKQFKCINPGRVFPEWLADAGLRAPGSTILPIQFLACYSPSAISHTPRSKEIGGDEPETKKASVDYGIKQELKSIVGRMLWREMWGPYVQADKWWWEDQDIVEECERMGTCWEYAIIEALKQG